MIAFGGRTLAIQGKLNPRYMCMACPPFGHPPPSSPSRELPRDQVWPRVVPSAVRGSAIVKPLELICVTGTIVIPTQTKKKGRLHRGLVHGTFSLICPSLL